MGGRIFDAEVAANPLLGGGMSRLTGPRGSYLDVPCGLESGDDLCADDFITFPEGDVLPLRRVDPKWWQESFHAG